MEAAVEHSRPRWIIASLGALTVIVVLMMLFRFPASPTPLTRAEPALESRQAIVNVARPDDRNRVLEEEAELRDLRPLFLPTERNAALPEPRLEPGRTFLDNDQLNRTYTDSEAQVSKDLPPITTLAGKPVEQAGPLDALSPAENTWSLQSFGRETARVQPVPTRSGYLEVAAFTDGEIALAAELPMSARPSGDKSWGPIELMGVIDAAGLVGPLVVTDGSRVEEIDTHFKNYLAQKYRIGDRLSPGFYRITVAP
jgi:hypothetical protein